MITKYYTVAQISGDYSILEDDDKKKKPLIRGFPKAVTLVLCYLLVLLHQSNPHDNLS